MEQFLKMYAELCKTDRNKPNKKKPRRFVITLVNCMQLKQIKKVFFLSFVEESKSYVQNYSRFKLNSIIKLHNKS